MRRERTASSKLVIVPGTWADSSLQGRNNSYLAQLSLEEPRRSRVALRCSATAGRKLWSARHAHAVKSAGAIDRHVETKVPWLERLLKQRPAQRQCAEARDTAPRMGRGPRTTAPTAIQLLSRTGKDFTIAPTSSKWVYPSGPQVASKSDLSTLRTLESPI